jgi:hypothetical protein
MPGYSDRDLAMFRLSPSAFTALQTPPDAIESFRDRLLRLFALPGFAAS